MGSRSSTRLHVERPRSAATGEREAGDLEHAQRRFVAMAAHELRTPLTSLHLMLSLLDEELRRPTPDLVDAREQVARALRQSARVTALCRQLLDLSRLDSGVPLRRVRVDLRAVARAVMAEFPEDASLVLGDPEDDAGVWAIADPGAVAQILRILLENGLRFAPAGMPVRVCARQAGDHAELGVTNGGPPIRDDDRDRIFGRFERGRDERDGTGSGLGLAIGRELARRMGGDLRLGAGRSPTRFILRLPAARRRSSG
jgi:signal transduction histidine kinase